MTSVFPPLSLVLAALPRANDKYGETRRSFTIRVHQRFPLPAILFGQGLEMLSCVTASTPQVTINLRRICYPFPPPVPRCQAVCLDNSPGYFYAALNSSSSDFIFRLMGGGACVAEQEICAENIQDKPIRSTSDGMPDTAYGFGVLSGDAAENPLYSTYNRIFVPYCTQDSFLMDTESSDGTLQFRGRPYLE